MSEKFTIGVSSESHYSSDQFAKEIAQNVTEDIGLEHVDLILVNLICSAIAYIINSSFYRNFNNIHDCINGFNQGQISYIYLNETPSIYIAQRNLTPELSNDVNYEATKNLIEATKRLGQDRLMDELIKRQVELSEKSVIIVSGDNIGKFFDKIPNVTIDADKEYSSVDGVNDWLLQNAINPAIAFVQQNLTSQKTV